MDYRGKKIVIMGLGGYRDGSGIMAALYFSKAGAREVLVTDLKPAAELKAQLKRLKGRRNVKLVLGRHRFSDFRSADVVFQNPSVPDTSSYLTEARKRRIPIINDWNIFLENENNFLIGITGTRGKSTTSALISEIFRAAGKNAVLCGNIGVSPLKYLGKLKKEDVVVAELSSWLLRGFRTAKKSPQIAVLTNLLVDHQDKYPGLEAYYRDKENIFLFQNAGDFLVANRGNAEVRKRVEKAPARLIWFSLRPIGKLDGAYLKEGKLYFQFRGKRELITPASALRIKGESNLENALAAVAAAKAYGLPTGAVRKALRQFTGLSGRLEFLGKSDGVEFYNDTTATTPDAAIAALSAFSDKSGRIILLAGGYDKRLEFSKMAALVKKCAKETILLRGSATDKIKRELKKRNAPFAEVASMKEAVAEAARIAKRGDLVLLSPGAASFGMFKNEYDRGSQFNKEVGKILRKNIKKNGD